LWGREKLDRKNYYPINHRYIDTISNLIDIAIELRNVDKIMKNHPEHKTTFILALKGDNARSNLSTEQTAKDVKLMLEDSKVSEQRQKILHWLKCADPTINHKAA
jgi:hypothetical protein